MIVRVFRATIREGRVNEFMRMVQEQSIPWLERSDGMLQYIPGEPMDESSREFAMVTLWRDLDSLKAFAGDSWEKPIVTSAEKPLVEAMTAHHYTHFDKEPAV